MEPERENYPAALPGLRDAWRRRIANDMDVTWVRLFRSERGGPRLPGPPRPGQAGAAAM